MRIIYDRPTRTTRLTGDITLTGTFAAVNCEDICKWLETFGQVRLDERITRLEITERGITYLIEAKPLPSRRAARRRTTTRIKPRPDGYPCDCAAEEGNDWCGTSYCKHPPCPAESEHGRAMRERKNG